MKVHGDSISWYELGRLARFNRKKAGTHLFANAVVAAFLGFLIAFALITYKQLPLTSKGSLILITILPVALFLFVGARGLFGRSVALTTECVVTVPLGSTIPRRFEYSQIDHFRIVARCFAGEEFRVLQIFLNSSKIEEIELQESSDVDAITAFLKTRELSVEVSA